MSKRLAEHLSPPGPSAPSPAGPGSGPIPLSELLNNPSQGPERAFGVLIKQLHQVLNTVIEARMRAEGINMTFPRAVALFSLIERPGMSGAEMARYAMVSPQTMHQIMQRLEQDGLIARRADPVHGRVQRTEITDAGRALFVRGATVAESIFENVQAGLKQAERDELLRLLHHCLVNVRTMQNASGDRSDFIFENCGEPSAQPPNAAPKRAANPEKSRSKRARKMPSNPNAT